MASDAPVADLAAARREAEEALERHNICGARHRANCFCGEVAIEAALRSFLAASEPAPEPVSNAYTLPEEKP